MAGIENHHKLKITVSAWQQLFLLGYDIRTLGALGKGLFGIEGRPPELADRRRAAVVGVIPGLPAHGIEIGNLHFMPGLLKMADGEIFQRAIERARFRMGV